MSAIDDMKFAKAGHTHRSFILSTWVKSNIGSYKDQRTKAFAADYEKLVAESMWRHCWVATDDQGEVIYGWVCYREGDLYYAYVPPDLRGKGVFSAILEEAKQGGTVVGTYKRWPYKFMAPVNPYLGLAAYIKRDDE